MARWGCALGLVLVLLATSARAEDDKPWARDVSQPQQRRANALFAEANTLFEQGLHADAVTKYREAIELWDHPRIRFNMAVTLIRLDQLVAAADAIEAALRFGRAPFTADLYGQALDYDHLIRGRVGTIAAACSQPGVRVFLDGRHWFTCPGAQRIRLLAGEHVIVAERSGFHTTSRQVFLTGAATSSHTIELAPLEKHERYPTARWIPWSVAGAGVAVALSGLGTWFAGRNDKERFEARHATECATRCSEGLADQQDLRALRDRAEFEGDLGIGLMVAGGAIAIGGLMWATVINRPSHVMLDVAVSRDGGATVHATWRLP